MKKFVLVLLISCMVITGCNAPSDYTKGKLKDDFTSDDTSNNLEADDMGNNLEADEEKRFEDLIIQ